MMLLMPRPVSPSGLWSLRWLFTSIRLASGAAGIADDNVSIDLAPSRRLAFVAFSLDVPLCGRNLSATDGRKWRPERKLSLLTSAR
jgi:hypothetical protein